MRALFDTALEPSPITPSSFRFGRRLARDFRRRGSAFGIGHRNTQQKKEK